jgi:hypothetical protein
MDNDLWPIDVGVPTFILLRCIYPLLVDNSIGTISNNVFGGSLGVLFIFWRCDGICLLNLRLGRRSGRRFETSGGNLCTVSLPFRLYA